jgi:uncharacterized repeat protein (TIGR03803 family)
LVFDSSGNLYGVTARGGPDNPNCELNCGVVYELSPTNDGARETILYNFCSVGNCLDGAIPQGSLTLDSQGNLYGTTLYGGSGNQICPGGNGGMGCGTVYKLSPTPDGWQETVIYSFCSMGDNCSDGGSPVDAVSFDAAGNLYGAANYTPNNPAAGLVFELMPGLNNSWTYSVLHIFDGPPDGKFPYGGIAIDATGNLYGTTAAGGTDKNCNGGCGILYQLQPVLGGWEENVLHNFTDGNDGASPQSGLAIDATGTLYGVTLGGRHHGGTVFSLAPNPTGGWKESIVHSFSTCRSCAEGSVPYGVPALDSAGNVYGVTQGGGLHDLGVVFKLSPKGDGRWMEQTVSLTAGQTHTGVTLDQSGKLYGNTTVGGWKGDGIVFQVVP